MNKLDRRIVIYENNSQTGKGEPVFSFGQHVNEKNNIMERDLAYFLLQMEKSKNRPINVMMVVKYIIFNKNRAYPVVELIDYIFHRKDFKPIPAPLPVHCTEKECRKEEVRHDLEVMGV